MSAGSRGAALRERWSVAALAAAHGGELDPTAGDAVVERVVEPGAGSEDDDLVLVTSLRRARELGARGVVLCTPAVAKRCGSRRWVHPHALWVLADLIAPPDTSPSRSPTLVEAGAEIAATAAIGAGAIVLAGARVGAGCVIEPGAVVYPRVTLGSRVVVGANAVVGRPGFGWATGPGGDVRRVPHVGGVLVEDDAEIGPLATVDAGTLGPTTIGRGAKLDAHVHVGHNVAIGAGTFVAAQSGFAGSARVGAGVLVGGQAGITDHARIGDGARVAAKSGVIGDVPARAEVAGYPAISRLRWLRAWARLLAPGR